MLLAVPEFGRWLHSDSYRIASAIQSLTN